MRIDLNVPFAEKDKAKKAGARWDGVKKCWYVVDVEDLMPFMGWMPKHLTKPCKVKSKPIPIHSR